MKDREHVWRLVAVLIVAGVVGLTAQRLLRPKGYGAAGSYRIGGWYDVMSQEPMHQGEASCNECHDDIVELHDKDIHFNVNCEDCHGPGNLHVKYHSGEDDSIGDEKAAMPTEYTREGCLFCHRKLTARPRNFPQVDPEEHYRFLHITDRKTRCIECHSPHEPLFLLTQVDKARMHPIIYECNDCHKTEMTKSHRDVPDHPAIFVCQDCHPKVVEDAKEHAHTFLRCTACHLFHQENETAGRIFKNGNQRFCLLCHAKKPFKNKDEQPQIEADAHIAEYAKDMDMDLDKLKADPKACLACHLDAIHDSELIGSKEAGEKNAGEEKEGEGEAGEGEATNE